MLQAVSLRPAVGTLALLFILSVCTPLPAWAQVTLTQGPEQIAVEIDGKPFTAFTLEYVVRSGTAKRRG